MAMSKEHKERIKKNFGNLVKHMKVGPIFLAKFRYGDVLSESQLTIIENPKVTKEQKATKVLTFLEGRGGKAFNRLIEALKETQQEPLVNLLCPPTKNIHDHASIQAIIHLIDAAPRDLAVIPMTDDQKQNREDLMSAGKIYPVPLGKPHGRAVIVKCGPEGDITEADGELLTKLFVDLHYQTTEYSCRNEDDLMTQLRKVVQELISKTGSDFDSLVLFVLGSCNDTRHNVDGITSLFDGDRCLRLKNKPKLFFIANEGTKPAQALGLDEPDHRAQAKSHLTRGVKADVKADQLVVLFNASTSFGPVGGRFGGSTFIKGLAHSFASHARESSIEAILGQVIAVGSELNRTRAMTYSLDLQQSRLRYEFYFNP